MKQKKVISNFSGFPQGELEAVGQAIIKAMTGNSFFSTLADDVANGAAALSDYSQSLADARLGGHGAVSAKNEKKEALKWSLHVIAERVNHIAKGNKVMLDSTAIPLAKDGSPAHRKDAGATEDAR
jgi:hypothetical protein